MMRRRQQLAVITFNIFTIMLWGAFVYAFLTRTRELVSWSVVDLYLIALSYFASDKEIRRWRHEHRSTKHRGELIVLGWIITVVFMLGVEVAGGQEHGYHVPAHMPLTVGGVVIIYLITQYLKTEYRKGFPPERNGPRAARRLSQRHHPARRKSA